MGALTKFYRSVLVVVVLAVAGTAGVAQAAGETGRRVALIFGNSAYQTVGMLVNPVRDADAVAESFQRLGFDVTHIDNANVSMMRSALQDFELKAAGAEIAVVYYAGHGIELGGDNYLIPIDAKLTRDTHVQDEAIPLTRVLAAVEGATKLRLVLLDACRNNPFASQMEVTNARRAIGRGLARVEPTGSTLVAYAAKEGTTADDGDADHSPYTAALLANLETPGLEVNFLFRRVRDDVMQRTGGMQEPFVYGSLGGTPIYFKPEPETPQVDVVQQRPGVVDNDASVASAYQAAVAINTIEAWDAFLKYHDSGYYADLARAARNKLDPPIFVANIPSQPEITEQAQESNGDRCDRLAAYEYDPQRPAGVAGVPNATLRQQLDDALDACTKAAQEQPRDARYTFNLARVTNMSGRQVESVGLYRAAAELGSAAGMNDLGVSYQLGTGLSVDYDQARQWYEKAAAGGSTDAMANLGNLYDQGLGVTQDFVQSGQWYQKGADLGNADAMAAIGYRYDNGRGVAQDFAEARRWYEKAALKGSVYAMNMLGFLFDWGRGGAVDSALAKYWYEKAAAEGNAFALSNLGNMYQNGRGVAVDFAKARGYFEQAAALGNAFAMNGLGDLYANGRGVTQDYGQAAQWYQKAADGGNAEAMNSLGNLYDAGTGVQQDYALARSWYEKAAGAGNGNAVHNLGYLYEVGHGVGRDAARAASYYVQALSMRNAATITEFRDNSTSYSAEVRRAVQQFLIDRGYLTGPADGVIGDRSKDALTAWQNG